MKGFKSTVSRPQGSLTLVMNLLGELVFPNEFDLLTSSEDSGFACF